MFVFVLMFMRVCYCSIISRVLHNCSIHNNNKPVRWSSPSNLRRVHPRIRAFSYASSLPVTWQRWQSHQSIRRGRKPTRRSHCSVIRRTGVIAEVLQCGNRDFSIFCSCDLGVDLHIRTWPVLSGDTGDVQILTSYVNAFESYRLIDR